MASVVALIVSTPFVCVFTILNSTDAPAAALLLSFSVTLSDADKNALYDVYHKADTKVVVGRNETYTVSDTSTVNGKQETTYENESQYGFALVTISSGETTTYTITSRRIRCRRIICIISII